jgi:hypothetical protein
MKNGYAYCQLYHAVDSCQKLTCLKQTYFIVIILLQGLRESPRSEKEGQRCCLSLL